MARTSPQSISIFLLLFWGGGGAHHTVLHYFPRRRAAGRSSPTPRCPMRGCVGRPVARRTAPPHGAGSPPQAVARRTSRCWPPHQRQGGVGEGGEGGSRGGAAAGARRQREAAIGLAARGAARGRDGGAGSPGRAPWRAGFKEWRRAEVLLAATVPAAARRRHARQRRHQVHQVPALRLQLHLLGEGPGGHTPTPLRRGFAPSLAACPGGTPREKGGPKDKVPGAVFVFWVFFSYFFPPSSPGPGGEGGVPGASAGFFPRRSWAGRPRAGTSSRSSPPGPVRPWPQRRPRLPVAALNVLRAIGWAGGV